MHLDWTFTGSTSGYSALKRTGASAAEGLTQIYASLLFYYGVEKQKAIKLCWTKLNFISNPKPEQKEKRKTPATLWWDRAMAQTVRSWLVCSIFRRVPSFSDSYYNCHASYSCESFLWRHVDPGYHSFGIVNKLLSYQNNNNIISYSASLIICIPENL